jgi:Fe-S-cluster containining protein
MKLDATHTSGTSAPGGSAPQAMVTATVGLTVSGQKLEAKITVPAGPVRVRQMLPAFRSLAEAVIDQGVKQVVANGERISCAKGCGACCRQLVPIAEAEARQVRDLVNDLPEPRRSEIRSQFAAARHRLEEAGLLEQLEHPVRFPDGELRPLGLKYFALGIACPFLEEESCSIHPERPIACREYLVTSPAEECAQPNPHSVRYVPLAGKVSNAVIRLAKQRSERFIPWVPLILALSWAESHPDERPQPGPELLLLVFENLARGKVPGSNEPVPETGLGA